MSADGPLSADDRPDRGEHTAAWMKLEARLTRRVTATGAYGMAVVVEKAGSLIVVPMLAAFLTPAQFGRYDVVVSFLELFVLIAAAGLAPQLIRFAQTAASPSEERRCAAEILGVGVIVATIWSMLAVVFAEQIIDTFGLSVSVLAFQIVFVAGALDIFMAVPFVWFRFKDRAVLFLIIAIARVASMAIGFSTTVILGYGVDGLLIVGGCIGLTFSTICALIQYSETGLIISRRRIVQTLRYGVPLVGAAIATYLMLSASRVFANGHVPDEEIGYLGLALRLALAVFILLYPIEMWWAPKRIAVLNEPDGLERSAQIWGLQTAMLVYGAVGVSLATPLFVLVLLPSAYAEIVYLVPIACIAFGLHQLSSFSNVGSLRRETGYQVLAIDGAGAVVTVLGYLILIPIYGVYGALFAMIAGHATRFVAYLAAGARTTPIKYPFRPAALAIALGVLAVLAAPGIDAPAAHILWSAFVAVAAPIAFVAIGLAPRPVAFETRLRKMVRHVF